MAHASSDARLDVSASGPLGAVRAALGEAAALLVESGRRAWSGADIESLGLATDPISSWTPEARAAADAFHALCGKLDDGELRSLNVAKALRERAERLEWLPEWAELLAPAVARVGVDPLDSEEGQAAAQFFLHCPEFARLVMASPRGWDAVFAQGAAELMVDGRSERDAVGEELSRAVPLADRGKVARKHWADRDQARAFWMWPEILDRAENDGLLDHLALSPRLGVWTLRLALAGNAERFARAIARGPDLSFATPEQSRGLFENLLHRAYYPATGALGQKDYGKAAWRKAQAADDASKGAIWAALGGAGMPPGSAASKPSYASAVGRKLPEDGFSAVEVEAARGGLHGPQAALLWGALELELPEPRRAFYGGAPLRWAFARGLDPKDWATAHVQTLLARPEAGARVESLLVELAAGGVRLGGAGDEKLPRALEGGYDPLHLTLAKAGARADGMRAAARMGMDVFELDRQKRPPLEALYELDRVKGQDLRLAAYLAAAEEARAGGAALLLAQRGAGGEGPMHWAARGLCSASVELLAQFGVDPMGVDAAGKTAGHWAARRHGARFAAKIAPTLDALGRAGQDWGAVDLKGRSALAELSRRGPMEPLLPIVERAPGSLFAKGKSARSAAEMLAERASRGEAKGFAQVEAATLSGAAGSDGGGGAAPARKRRL